MLKLHKFWFSSSGLSPYLHTRFLHFSTTQTHTLKHINRFIATNRLQSELQIVVYLFSHLVQTNLQVNSAFIQINKFSCQCDSLAVSFADFYVVHKSNLSHVQMLRALQCKLKTLFAFSMRIWFHFLSRSFSFLFDIVFFWS